MKKQVKRIVYLVLSFMLVLTSILGVLRPASAANLTPVTLSSLAAGDTVKFGGQTWIVLDPSTGYLLLQGSYGSDQEFDSDNTNTFDPSDSNNIAYYLNHTFYNSLPSADQALIQSHNWTTGNESNESSGSVTCNIGLISYSEYNTYYSHITNLSEDFWTLTPYSGNSNYVWGVYLYPYGGLFEILANFTIAVRPALYLNSGILVSGGNGGSVDVSTPTITTQPTSLTAAAGQNATFSVVATGDRLSYEWEEDIDGAWQAINDATSDSYTTGTLATSDSGTSYRCVVTNTLNGNMANTTSSAATLTVAAGYTANVSANLSASGTVSGGGTYAYDSNVMVTAAANRGFGFIDWTENGAEVSTDPSYTFTMGTADQTLVANFQNTSTPVITVVNGELFSVTVRNTYGTLTGTDSTYGTLTGTASGNNTLISGTLSGLSTTTPTDIPLGNGTIEIKAVNPPSTTLVNASFY